MVKPRNLNLAVLRNDPNEIYEGTCLSTDTKPTNWPDNSILFELDTGTRYYSNSGTWYPVGGGADSGSGGGGGGLTSLDWADINSYSGTVDGNPFNSETDSLRIGDGLYEPFTYGFVDSLDAPFAMTSAYPPNPGETQSITITELPTFFETTENYSDTVPSGDFRLAMADKVIKVKKSQTDTELLMILIVGNFEIAYGGTN